MENFDGIINYVGQIGTVCCYHMRGQYFIRTASNLTGKRVKKDRCFQQTRINAERLGKASRVGSSVYKNLPKSFRRFWMYRAFTGEAMQLLKAGKTEGEANAILTAIYNVPIRVPSELTKSGRLKMADPSPIPDVFFQYRDRA